MGAGSIGSPRNAGSSSSGLVNGTMYKQAHDLRRWIETESPHLLKRWKVLTFLPSWGDQWWSDRNIDRLREHMRTLFAYMRRSLPFTYVNLVGASAHPSSLDEMLMSNMRCTVQVSLWKFANVVRGVRLGAGADAYAAQINNVFHEIQAEFDDGENFVVRVRPALREFRFERRLTEASCFHPSKELAEELAYGVLLNMVEAAPSNQVAQIPLYKDPPDPQVVKLFREFRKRVDSAHDLVFY